MFRVALWVSGEFWEVLCVLVFGGLRCAGMRFFRKLFVLGFGVELVGALCFGLCYGFWEEVLGIALCFFLGGVMGLGEVLGSALCFGVWEG